MNTKQLLLVGVAVAAVSKFYFGHETKAALWSGAVAIIASALADNILPESK